MFNKYMHERNPYKERPPDFAQLADTYEPFRQHCTVEADGKVRVNFGDPSAVRCLSWAMMKQDFDLDVELPEDCLVPRVPQRINYILWLEDLILHNRLQNGGSIYGIDIGTGASCVYPLLAVRKCGWNFLATDKDEKAVEVALRNVKNNGLEGKIFVEKVTDRTILQTILNRYMDVDFAFCMCNPPFFDNVEKDVKFVDRRLHNDRRDSLINDGVDKGSRRSRTRRAPHSKTMARSNEVCAEGGEVAFIGRLIDESVRLRHRVKIFTSMVGKKTSVSVLKRRLQYIEDVKYGTTTFSQGKTQRWAIAWTFLPSLNLQMIDIASEATKKVAPVVLEIDSCLNAVSVFRNLMTELEIDLTETESSGSFLCQAYADTWSHRRRKRRAIDRENNSQLPAASKYMKLQNGDAATRLKNDVSVSVKLGVGDGTDSLADDGNCQLVERHEQTTVGLQVCMASLVSASFNEDKWRQKQQPLVRFSALVNPRGSNVIELRPQDAGGTSSEALHRIAQCCRNILLMSPGR